MQHCYLTLENMLVKGHNTCCQKCVLMNEILLRHKYDIVFVTEFAKRDIQLMNFDDSYLKI